MGLLFEYLCEARRLEIALNLTVTGGLYWAGAFQMRCKGQGSVGNPIISTLIKAFNSIGVTLVSIIK
jgi:hypothetical protein